MRRRPGFVLLTVLWVTSAAGLIVFEIDASIHSAYGASRNRVAAERARWAVTGCANALQSALDSMLRMAATPTEQRRLRADLRGYVAEAMQRSQSRCSLDVEAVGAKISVNEITPDVLRRLLISIAGGRDIERLRDTIVRALEIRPSRGQMVDSARATWRERTIEDAGEIEDLARALDLPELTQYLRVEGGPVSLRDASPELLASLPGMSHTSVAEIIRLRELDDLPQNLTDLLGRLPRGAADTLLAKFPEFARLASIDAESWIIRLDAISGRPGVHATAELVIALRARPVVLKERMEW